MEHDLGTAAQEPGLPELPQLADYLAYAAFHNPGLRAAFEQWKAVLWKIPQVQSLPDPRFTYTYFVEQVETRVGPQRQKFALAQTFPWLSKLELRGDEAAREAEAKRALYEAAKWKLYERVKKAYFEYAYLRQAVAVTEENIRLLKHPETKHRKSAAPSIRPHALVGLFFNFMFASSSIFTRPTVKPTVFRYGPPGPWRTGILVETPTAAGRGPGMPKDPRAIPIPPPARRTAPRFGRNPQWC